MTNGDSAVMRTGADLQIGDAMIGTNIRLAREHWHMSQQDLADRAGLDLGTVVDAEAGDCLAWQGVRIADALRVEFQELLDGVDFGPRLFWCGG